MRLPRLLSIAMLLLPPFVGCSQHQTTLATAPATPSQHLREPPQRHMQAPFVLSFTGPQQPTGTALELFATLQSQLGQPASVDLVLTLPSGATLVEGLPKQAVPLSPSQPNATRSFRVALAGPLQQPIRLRGTLQSDGTMGAVADREYPAPLPPPPPAPSAPRNIGGLPLATPLEIVQAH